MLASEKFDEAAYNMLPLTEDIYLGLQHLKVRAFLDIPYTPPKYVKHADTSISATDTLSPLVQLNMKVSVHEREAFSYFCQINKLTQREGFAMLLSNIDNSAATQVIAQQKATIQKQLETIKHLQTIPRGAKADIKLKEALDYCQTATSKYIELLLDDIDIMPLPLKPQTWNNFTKQFPNRSDYIYPTDDNFLTIKLEAICYGRGRTPAIFIWGVDTESGKKVKLRFYKKRDYIGLSIPHSPFLYKGATLLVGYIKASDEAVDLCIALPLLHQALPQPAIIPDGKHASLNELIQRSRIKGGL